MDRQEDNLRDKDPPPREAASFEQLRQLIVAEGGDGPQLSSDLRDNPICSVSLDDSVPCVTVVWKCYATSAQLRFVHEAIIHLLQTHRLSKVLADDTALQTIHADDQQWIVRNWMPRAVRAGLWAAASKISSHYFGRLSTDCIRALTPPNLTIRTFDCMEDARQWLRGLDV